MAIPTVAPRLSKTLLAKGPGNRVPGPTVTDFAGGMRLPMRDGNYVTGNISIPKAPSLVTRPGLAGVNLLAKPTEAQRFESELETIAPRPTASGIDLYKLRGKPAMPGTNYKTPNSGNEELPTKGNYEMDKTKTLPNLRPALDALNYALANRSINKIRNTQLARKNMYYNTPSLSVRPVTDLPAEVLAAQQDALSQIRSTDASSDPTINLLSKNIAGAQRGKMRNEMIAGRATALLQDRNRFDEQQRQNQQAAAETENKNLDRAQDFADYKTGVNTAALEAKKDLTSGFLSNVGKNMGMGAEYNLGMSAVEQDNRRQAYNDELKLAAALPTEGERTAALKVARDNYAGYAAQPKLNYNQAMAKGAEGTFIAKLLTGTFRKP